MAIVARRVIQKLLTENARFSTVEQRLRQALAIDRVDDHSIAAEWEVLILNAMSKMAVLQHEPALGASKPDIHAAVATLRGTEEFIVDVVTVSNKGYEQKNPVEQFRDELARRARRHDLSPLFNLEVGGHWEGQPHRSHMSLRLPALSEFHSFFESTIEPYLRGRKDGGAPSKLVIKDDVVDITVEHVPGARTISLHTPSYSTRYSRTSNPIFSALKKKTGQLRRCTFSGPTGVILCSGDADLHSSTGAGHGLGSISREFFRQNRSLSFILTIWSLDSFSQRPGEYRSQLFLNPQARFPVSPEARELLEHLHTHLPPPLNSALNARYEIAFWRWGRGRYFIRSWKMTQTTVRISVRLLMEYLAGRITQEEFFARVGNSPSIGELFAEKLRNGQLLDSAAIIPDSDRDDDWIEFKFGPPSAAGGPLRV